MGWEKRKRAYVILMVLLFIFSSFSVMFFNSDHSSSEAQSPAVGVQPLQVSGPMTEVYVKYTLGILNNTLVPGNYKVNTNYSINDTMSQPYYVIYDSLNGNMYVSDYNLGKIYEISSITNRIIATINEGGSCIGMAYDPSNGNIYVATGPNSVLVINNSTLIASVPVGMSPGYIAYDSFNGCMYVENWQTGNVTVFNATTYQSVANINFSYYGAPWGITYNPFNKNIYLVVFSNNTILIINSSTNTITGRIWVGWAPNEILYDPENNYMYVTNGQSNDISVINSSTNKVIATISLGYTRQGYDRNPWGIAYDSQTHLIYVAEYLSGTVSVINPKNNSVVARVEVGVGPSNLAYDPSNGYIYVANWYSGTISIIDTHVYPAEYNVTFNETGLPPGAQWSVSLNGTVKNSTASSISFNESNGTYPYSVFVANKNYTPVQGTGVVTVSGANMTYAVKFKQLSSPMLWLYILIAVVVVVSVSVAVVWGLRKRRGSGLQ